MDTSTTIDPRHAIGANNPPVTLADDFADRFKQHLDRYAELMASAREAPETIGDDETHKKVVELAKEMRSLEIVLDNSRDIEKAPFAKKVDEVNGWFKSRIEPLSTLRKALQLRHKEYADRKAAEEKRRLEEEAERKRQIEREALRLAAEAQAATDAAVQAAADARTAADDAKLQREAATTEVEIAQADYTEARAKSGAIYAKLLEIDADIARRRKEGETITAEQIAAAKGDLPEQHRAARQAVTDAEGRLRDARKAAVEAKQKQQDAERKAEEEKRAAAAANRQVEQHMDDAIRADKAASRIEQRASGPAADLARVRSEHGAVGTLQRQWQARITDRTQLDKAALWPFIHEDALSAALWKWMMAQPAEKRVMAGAAMTEETIGSVR